jgi:hypothetical protein
MAELKSLQQGVSSRYHGDVDEPMLPVVEDSLIPFGNEMIPPSWQN